MRLDTIRLTPPQLEAVQRTIRLRPDADWSASPLPEQHVQLLGIGRGYIWAVIVSPDGSVRDREAVLGPWKEVIT